MKTSKKGIIAIIAASMALLALVTWVALVLWPKHDSGIDFSNKVYIERHQNLVAPQNFSERYLSNYEKYDPVVQDIMTIYSDEGLEEALLMLHKTLAKSSDSVQLMEIHEGLLFGTSPILFQDPQAVFNLFDNYPSADENEKAAAQYLVALAYANGNFEGAIGSGVIPSGEEEWREISNEKYGELKAEGLNRLERISDAYCDTMIAVLAKLDFLLIRDSLYKDVSIEEWGTLATFIDGRYPDTAFATGGYTILAIRYKKNSELNSAIEFYRKALQCPDFQTFREGVTVHDEINEMLGEIEGSSP